MEQYIHDRIKDTENNTDKILNIVKEQLSEIKALRDEVKALREEWSKARDNAFECDRCNRTSICHHCKAIEEDKL